MGYEFALGFERPRKGEFIKQPLSQEEINRQGAKMDDIHVCSDLAEEIFTKAAGKI